MQNKRDSIISLPVNPVEGGGIPQGEIWAQMFGCIPWSPHIQTKNEKINKGSPKKRQSQLTLDLETYRT